jgi:hypothetical protein
VQQIFIHNFKSSVGGFGNMVLDTQHVLRHMGELACSKRLDFQSVLVMKQPLGSAPIIERLLPLVFHVAQRWLEASR